MRIFDAVHGLIPFTGEHEKLQKILDTRAFQRLRRINQLGFSDFVYPGATHTRFAHSVGVFKNARDMLKIAKKHLGDAYDEDREEMIMLAALLHDVGHGPFSHAFEGAIKNIDSNAPRHEAWSARIVCEDKGIGGALSEIREGIGEEIANLLNQDSGTDLYGEIVSSQFDADRMDYLQRDARATGIDIGNFEREWLLDCLRIHNDANKPKWVVASKGRQAVEAYLLARVQLQESIYFHPTRRGFDIIFQRLVKSLNTALKNGDTLPSAVRHNPVAIYLREIGSETIEIEKYLAMDDAAAWTLIHALADEKKNSELHTLAQRLAFRSPLSSEVLTPLGPGYSLEEMKVRLNDFGAMLEKNLPLKDWQYDKIPLNIYSSGSRKHPEVYIQDRSDEGSIYPLDQASSLILGLQNNAFFYHCGVYFDSKEKHDRLAPELRQAAKDFRSQNGGGVDE